MPVPNPYHPPKRVHVPNPSRPHISRCPPLIKTYNDHKNHGHSHHDHNHDHEDGSGPNVNDNDDPMIPLDRTPDRSLKRMVIEKIDQMCPFCVAKELKKWEGEGKSEGTEDDKSGSKDDSKNETPPSTSLNPTTNSNLTSPTVPLPHVTTNIKHKSLDRRRGRTITTTTTTTVTVSFTLNLAPVSGQLQLTGNAATEHTGTLCGQVENKEQINRSDVDWADEIIEMAERAVPAQEGYAGRWERMTLEQSIMRGWVVWKRGEMEKMEKMAEGKLLEMVRDYTEEVMMEEGQEAEEDKDKDVKGEGKKDQDREETNIDNPENKQQNNRLRENQEASTNSEIKPNTKPANTDLLNESQTPQDQPQNRHPQPPPPPLETNPPSPIPQHEEAPPDEPTVEPQKPPKPNTATEQGPKKPIKKTVRFEGLTIFHYPASSMIYPGSTSSKQ